jgi:hypothetical protein
VQDHARIRLASLSHRFVLLCARVRP